MMTLHFGCQFLPPHWQTRKILQNNFWPEEVGGKNLSNVLKLSKNSYQVCKILKYHILSQESEKIDTITVIVIAENGMTFINDKLMVYFGCATI